MPPSAIPKSIIDKFDYNKIKTFVEMKDVMGKVNREAAIGKRCFQCPKLMRLIFRYVNRIYANQEIRIPVGRQVKDVNRPYTKLKTQKVDEHMTRYPYTLIFRKMLIKTIMRHQFIPIILTRIS